MSYKEIKPGKYIGKCIGGFFENSKVKGTPTAVLGFQFIVGAEGEPQKIEKMRKKIFFSSNGGNDKDPRTVAEKSFDLMVGTLGYIGFDHNAPALLKTKEGQEYFDASFVADKEVELVIEEQKDQDGNTAMDNQGFPYLEIRWVNELGGGQMAGAAVTSVLGGMDLKAMAAAARARTGAKAPATRAPAAKELKDEEIPF